MQTLKFKTTIKCSGCLAQVTPVLDKAVGEDNWKVDIQTPNKVLTIAVEDEVNSTAIVKVVESAGYKAEVLN